MFHSSESWIFGLDYWELSLIILPKQQLAQPQQMAVPVVAAQLFFVTCPPGVSSGAMVAIAHPVTGQQLQVQIPAGISAGMPFQVQA